MTPDPEPQSAHLGGVDATSLSRPHDMHSKYFFSLSIARPRKAGSLCASKFGVNRFLLDCLQRATSSRRLVRFVFLRAQRARLCRGERSANSRLGEVLAIVTFGVVRHRIRQELGKASRESLVDFAPLG